MTSQGEYKKLKNLNKSPDISPDKIINKLQVLVGILINSQGQICISRRKEGKHLAGYWEFPGGKKDPGETDFQALVREFKEEIGIEIIKASPWFVIHHDYPDLSVSLDIWNIEVYKGIPRPQEGQELRMISKNQLGEYKFPEGNAEILKRLQEKRKKE